MAEEVKAKRVLKRDDPFEKLWRETFVNDPSRTISRIIGRELLFDIGAFHLHRVGLMNGIGFRVPVARRDIDFVRIRPARNGQLMIELAQCERHPDPLVENNITLIHTTFCDANRDALRETLMKELHDD